jgi:hypothetical protein
LLGGAAGGQEEGRGEGGVMGHGCQKPIYAGEAISDKQADGRVKEFRQLAGTSETALLAPKNGDQIALAKMADFHKIAECIRIGVAYGHRFESSLTYRKPLTDAAPFNAATVEEFLLFQQKSVTALVKQDTKLKQRFERRMCTCPPLRQ